MRHENSTNSAAEATDAPPAREGAGHSELIMAGLVLAFAIYLTVGIATMSVPPGAESPGPKFFPTLLACALYALAALLTVQHFRDHAEHRPGAAEGRVRSNWRAMGTVLVAFTVFAVLLRPVGWILSATLLFWLVSRALGSRRTLFDVGLALVFASAIQVAFSSGLGLNLPAGFLEGAL
ncbi:tripartite tricarboxylate transporter TctB family protein [Promicromonospora sukumoe]|uniref:tripartite tricarboxylate transporter TctB family protein n=1 Tax=Promicromonospora sukumoe TaxID=88382 RepID=UPI0037CB1C83